MLRALLIVLATTLGVAESLPAHAATLCTLLIDADTGEALLDEGDCTTRVTPASTFKIPLAVMGFDAGLLTGPDAPVLSFRPGDPDWGGANWTRDTSPAAWMVHSVLWYSQRLTRDMGQDTLARYARAFGFGNADFSGDPGLDNGLERAWIASSLEVSPHEQAAFLRALLLDALPVAPAAMRRTRALLETHPVNDWTLRGKTGTAYPRRADRSFDYARGWGWYVGWATRADRRVIFVHLTQQSERGPLSPGIAARDAFLRDWPALVTP